MRVIDYIYFFKRKIFQTFMKCLKYANLPVKKNPYLFISVKKDTNIQSEDVPLKLKFRKKYSKKNFRFSNKEMVGHRNRNKKFTKNSSSKFKTPLSNENQSKQERQNKKNQDRDIYTYGR